MNAKVFFKTTVITLTLSLAMFARAETQQAQATTWSCSIVCKSSIQNFQSLYYKFIPMALSAESSAVALTKLNMACRNYNLLMLEYFKKEYPRAEIVSSDTFSPTQMVARDGSTSYVLPSTADCRPDSVQGGGQSINQTVNVN